MRLQVSYRAPTSCARSFSGGGGEGGDFLALTPTSERAPRVPGEQRGARKDLGCTCCLPEQRGNRSCWGGRRAGMDPFPHGSALTCTAACRLFGAAIPGTGAGCKVNLGRGLFPHKFRFAAGGVATEQQGEVWLSGAHSRGGA